MNKLLFTKNYWEQAWQDDPNTAMKKMRKAGQGSYQSKGFENWAEKFNADSFSPGGIKRTKRIITWIEQQTGSFEHLTILDVGAASGVFSIPFSKKGAAVHSLEPSSILTSMLEENAEHHAVNLNIINQSFEEAELEKYGTFDLVFASMCPALTNWKAVEKAISCADKYVYISLMAGAKENKLVEELMPVLGVEGESVSTDMYYLLQLLYVNDYSYQSLIERHQKTTSMSVDEVGNNINAWFTDYSISLNNDQIQKAVQYLNKTYGEEVPVTTGGKFGKVLIHL